MSAGSEFPKLLRTGRDERDKQRFAAFNSSYNNAAEGATCSCLLHHYPAMTHEDYWLTEDLATGEVVATSCLISWVCRYAGIELRVAQLEMVLSHPQYRGQGLVRAHIQRCIQAVTERDYDLSIIWGIPYFYRQFGYSYAGAGNTSDALPLWRIPDPARGTEIAVCLRSATIADIPELVAAYDRTMAQLDMHLARSPVYWKYLLHAAKHPVYMLENTATGTTLGYAIVEYSVERATVLENGIASAATALALLHMLKQQVTQEIVIAWPQTTPLAQLARSLGSQTRPGGQWLVRIADVSSFLTKIGPALERRLAASVWRGLSSELTINLFREAFRLRFSAGKLANVDALGFVDSSMGADGGDLCIPPDAFVRLLLGYRALDELFDAWPDIVVKPAARQLIDLLFPQMNAYLSTPYHYMGSV
jgi:predicted acetyltransferase